MPRKKDDPLLVARETFAVEVDGRPVIVKAGLTRVHASDPLVSGREHQFEPAHLTATHRSPEHDAA